MKTPSATPLSPLGPVAAAWALALVAGCATGVVAPTEDACARAVDDPVRFAFYAFFEPVSYSADPDPGSPGFGNHRGYEADLVTALEAMDERLVFARRPVAAWSDVWLRAATPAFDVVGGGVTILESRTLDHEGRRAVAFTSGHIAFRQSLLTRAADAERLASYDSLTRDVRVGVLRGTTGEARLLRITGIANRDGALLAGTRVETPAGAVVADGTSRYAITAAVASLELKGRERIVPPDPGMPQVVYLGDESGEEELLSALRDGAVDAVARGEVGNGEAARASDGAFRIAALDTLKEYGGFALDASDEGLLTCLDERIDWLTDERRVGYAQWRADPGVFLDRAGSWARRDEGS